MASALERTDDPQERARAIDRLYRTVNSRVERWLQYKLVGTAAAYREDAIAAAWAKLVGSVTVDLADVNAASGWLKTAAYTSALDLQAAHERQVGLSLDAPVSVGDDAPAVREIASPADTEAAVLRAERFREAIEKVAELPPQQRHGLMLKAVGHSYDEIAKLTGLTERQIDHAINDGRVAVRETTALTDRLFTPRRELKRFVPRDPRPPRSAVPQPVQESLFPDR